MDKNKKIIKLFPIRMVLIIIIVIIVFCFMAHMIVFVCGNAHILELEYGNEAITSGLPEEKTDCILILGAGIRNGAPSPMLKERLDLGVSLYKAGASNKILVSGDNGSTYYNEVQVMEDYLVEHGVPRDDIVRDHAGFSTYESVYRAKEIFCVDSVIIVTQRYHLYRATYVASCMGIKTYGADAHVTSFSGRYVREMRECLARVKDFITCIYKPKPTYLGDKIPIK